MKIFFIFAFFLLFTLNCTNTPMSNNQRPIEKDMLQYLETTYNEKFVIKNSKSMANEGSFRSKGMYELTCMPKKDPKLVFHTRVGYNKEKEFFVNFEYYKTVLLAQKAKAYAPSIINRYYPTFALDATLTNIQRILDKIPATTSVSYEQIVKEYPDKINTVLYIAIPQNPENDKETHLENLKNLFRDYRDAGHLNVSISLGFYNQAAEEKIKNMPDAFFDVEATPMERFQERQNFLYGWNLNFGTRSFPDLETYLKDIEEFIIVIN